MDLEVVRKELERILECAQFSRRALQLYESVRSMMIRELLLGELKHRLSPFNGQVELKPFKPHLAILSRLLNELPAKPELIDSAIECTEQLIAAIEQRFLMLANDVHDDAA